MIFLSRALIFSSNNLQKSAFTVLPVDTVQRLDQPTIFTMIEFASVAAIEFNESIEIPAVHIFFSGIVTPRLSGHMKYDLWIYLCFQIQLDLLQTPCVVSLCLLFSAGLVARIQYSWNLPASTPTSSWYSFNSGKAPLPPHTSSSPDFWIRNLDLFLDCFVISQEHHQQTLNSICDSIHLSHNNSLPNFCLSVDILRSTGHFALADIVFIAIIPKN